VRFNYGCNNNATTKNGNTQQFKSAKSGPRKRGKVEHGQRQKNRAGVDKITGTSKPPDSRNNGQSVGGFMSDNKQCICPDCGKIAEVRRQKTGKNLRYMHCDTKKCGGITTRSRSDFWQSIEQDHIGVFGELPKNQGLEKTPKVAPVAESSQDYTPEPQDTPEALEVIDGLDQNQPTEKSNLPKIAAAFFAVFGALGVIHFRNKKRSA
jgi:hypothetical protein